MSPESGPKDRNFTRLRNEIVDDGWLPVLKDSELRVYLVLARFVNRESGLSYPTVNKICKLSGVNKNLICEATEGLASKGLAKKHRTGKKFKYRNCYRIIKHPKINFSTIPKRKRRKRRYLKGEKNGKFKPIPKGTERGIPNDTDRGIPSGSESLTCPSGSDKKRSEKTNLKENQKDKVFLASGCSKEQPSPLPSSSNSPKSLKAFNKETIRGFIKDKGLEWLKEYLRGEGYDEGEIQALEKSYGGGEEAAGDVDGSK